MNLLKKYSKWAAAFIFAVAVITVYKTFDNISNITKFIGVILSAMSPFLWAFIIAYILNIPALKIQSVLERTKPVFIRQHSFGLSVLAVYLLTFGAMAWIIISLIPMLYRNIIDLYHNLPSYIDAAAEFINKLDIVRKISPDHTLGSNIRSAFTATFEKIDIAEFGKYAQGVFTITSRVVSAFISVVASVYMLFDKERIGHSVMHTISVFRDESFAKRAAAYASEVNRIFTGFLYSRFVCSIIMAVICSVVLSLFRVKYAVVLGIFIGAMDMIPYFGSIISSVIASAITLLTGGLFKGCLTAVSLLILQQLDGNLIAPKIMGDTLEIRPLWIVFAVTVGGTLFGFMGMLLSVPVLAVLRSLAISWLSSREAEKNQKENLSE